MLEHHFLSCNAGLRLDVSLFSLLDKSHTMGSVCGKADTNSTPFTKIAQQHLDAYCPYWRDYDCPSSYLMRCPQNRRWKRDLQNFENCGVVAAEEAKFIVWNAIRQAICDHIQPPFIAIPGSAFDGKDFALLKDLPELQHLDFTSVPAAFGIDFLLIGPVIGVVAIKIDHFNFGESTCFWPGTQKLPKTFESALQDLNRTASVLKRLLADGPISVRKVLFLPNLEESKFEIWNVSLPMGRYVDLVRQYGNAILMFKEDMVTDENTAPSIYESIQKILSASRLIPCSVYERGAGLLAGLASAIATESRDGINIELNDEAFPVHFSKEVKTR